MKRHFLICLMVLVGVHLRANESPPLDFEKEIAALIAGPQITVVHFWAPWCPNCKAEMTPEGWGKFVAENPKVKTVFINIWHKGQDGAAKLAAAGLGAQTNFVAFTHPNPARKSGERLDVFLGLPISWIPTTWIFKDGQLRYALNYGEVRFPMLQQMVRDSADAWDR
jgi:thiol-disulfide isomerase/thioredoxin